MAARRPTVRDVAELAGVSTATVSFAFQRPDEVREATRALVLNAAREIGYIPSAAARGLRRGTTGALGLHLFELPREYSPDADGDSKLDALSLREGIIPWAEVDEDSHRDPRAFPAYVDEVQRGFTLESRRQGRQVLLSSGSLARAEMAETAGRVDGLAVFHGDSSLASLAEVVLNMPVVLFSGESEANHHRVVVDNAGGMKQLVEHLVRDHGTVDLGWVGHPLVYDFAERRAAFHDAIAESGTSATGRIIDNTDLGDDRLFPGVVELIRSDRLPDALVCASDAIAFALIDTLRAAGLDVPRDVIVTGFDGVLATRLSAPTLTTVRQPMETMGRVAAHLLMADRGADAKPQTVRLGTKLQIGTSCGCPA